MSMGDNGPYYRVQKLGFASQASGPLKHLEVQQVIREKNITLPRVGDIWIPIDIGVRNCCSQFYKPKLEGDRILIIYNFGKDSHVICWLYCTDICGHFFWRYVNISDMEYIIRIGSNRLQFVEYEKKEKKMEIRN